jgi:(2Fe-2S) ferredoxin
MRYASLRGTGFAANTRMSTAAEIPQVFSYHVFSCYQQRPPAHPRGSCTAKGAPQLWERLAQRLQSEQLPGVAMVGSGCLGFCDAGPLMVVYPQGVWYRPKSTSDIDEIVDKHFKAGEIVEHLAVVLNP